MATAIAEIEAFVRREMPATDGSELAIGHGLLHVNRVRQHALTIAKGEGFRRLGLVEATALLHDVGLPRVRHRGDHAAASAEVAADYLTERVSFSNEETAAIVQAIAHHSDVAPIPVLRGASLADALTAILREADILDALGTVGLVRAFMTKHSRPPYDPANPKGAS